MYRFSVLIFFLILCFAHCKIQYTFSGINLTPDVKSFSVKYFPNRAPYVSPTLSQFFTEKLKDKFLDNTSLNLVNSNGHLTFEGVIKGYETRPMGIQADDKPASNRLTITISVKFTNSKDPKASYETDFSRYADYPVGKDIKYVENQLNEEIVTLIVEDIFVKSVTNW